MFQLKARRVVPVLALTTALSLLPLADVFAASSDKKQQPAEQQSSGSQLLSQVEEQIASFWIVLQVLWGDSGPRMDDNG